MPCSAFYDDYTLLSPVHLARGADMVCSQLLDVLGWRHACAGDGDKGLEFSPMFDVLGMSIDLGLLHQGTLVLTNKEGRIQSVCEMLRAARHDGSLAKHQGQVLLGLLRFAAGVYSGMTLKHVCVDLNKFVHSIASPSQDALRALCDRASRALLTLPPRCIKFTETETLSTSGQTALGKVELEAWELSFTTQRVAEEEFSKAAPRSWPWRPGEGM